MPPRGDAVVTLVHSHCGGRDTKLGGEVSGGGDAVRSSSGCVDAQGGDGNAGQSQFLWHTKHLAHALGADLE